MNTTHEFGNVHMDLPQEQVKALDQLRMRLSQLSISLKSLQAHLAEDDPLPSWPTLQSDASILGSNLHDLASILNDQRQLYTSMHAYPLPSFPGTTHDMYLQALLRKRLDPNAETWIDESLHLEDTSNSTNTHPFSAKQMRELWDWATPASREFLTQLLESEAMESDYTLAEQKRGIENVVTGIKSLDDHRDSGSDSDPDEEMGEEGQDASVNTSTNAKGAPVAMPLEGLLRFASGGDVDVPRSNR